MIGRKFFLINCVTLIWTALFAIEKRESPASFTTSLIIPCDISHFNNLPNLLQRYEEQTIIPNEIIIAISRADDNCQILIDKILLGSYSFPIRVLIDNAYYSAAGNRNRASEIANGDILIYQDADDIPHPRRIEVIKYFFEHFDISYLIHHYIFEKGEFSDFSTYESLHWYRPRYFSPHTGCNPAVSVLKQVFAQIKWPEIGHGEDALFNQNVLDLFPNRIVVEFPLYRYFRRSPSPNIDKPTFEIAK